MLDTIIIGAGWAGSVAARDLSSKGHKVLVVEARDRIGGRARTLVKGNAKVDVGCSWIHGYKEGNPARYIAKDLGVEAHLPKGGDAVIYGPDGPLPSEKAAALRAGLAAAQKAFKTPHPAPAPSDSLASALFANDSPLFAPSAGTSPNGSQPKQVIDPNTTGQPQPPDATSDKVDKQLAKDFARMLEVPLGLKLEKASLKWAGWEGTTNFAGSDAAPEGGFQALVEKVIGEAKSKGAEVKLDTAVTKIQQSDNGVTITAKGGHTYSARTVINTIPLAVLKDLPSNFYEPALPPHLQSVIAGTHVGVLEKIFLQYPSAWWPNAEKVASYTFLPTSSTLPTDKSSLEEIFNSSTLLMANFACPSLPDPTPTLLAFISDTPARLLVNHPTEKIIEAYHNFLISRFKPSSNPPSPSEGVMTNWLTDPLSKGATTTPSIISENGERSPMDFKELSRPVWDGKLGFAGEHTEMENRGSVAGAVLSGQREAARVDRLLNKLNEQ